MEINIDNFLNVSDGYLRFSKNEHNIVSSILFSKIDDEEYSLNIDVLKILLVFEDMRKSLEDGSHYKYHELIVKRESVLQIEKIKHRFSTLNSDEKK